MAGQQELLYVSCKQGGEITIVDVATTKVVDALSMKREEYDGIYPKYRGKTMAYQPDSTWAAPDHSVVYVSRYLAPLDEAKGMLRVKGDLAAFDPKTNELLWEIPVGGHANHMMGTPDGRYIFVPIRDKDIIEKVDVEERRLVGRVRCGWGAHGTAINRAGTTGYTGLGWGDKLVAFDTESLEVTKAAIPMGEAVRPFEITRDETRAFVQLSKLHGFRIVNLEREVVTGTVELPALPAEIALPTKASYTVDHGLRMNADKTLLYSLATIANYVAVYSLSDFRLLDVIETGEEPCQLRLVDGEKKLAVVNRKSQTVQFIDTGSHEIVGEAPTAMAPNRLMSITI